MKLKYILCRIALNVLFDGLKIVIIINVFYNNFILNLNKDIVLFRFLSHNYLVNNILNNLNLLDYVNLEGPYVLCVVDLFNRPLIFVKRSQNIFLDEVYKKKTCMGKDLGN